MRISDSVVSKGKSERRPEFMTTKVTGLAEQSERVMQCEDKDVSLRKKPHGKADTPGYGHEPPVGAKTVDKERLRNRGTLTLCNLSHSCASETIASEEQHCHLGTSIQHDACLCFGESSQPAKLDVCFKPSTASSSERQTALPRLAASRVVRRLSQADA